MASLNTFPRIPLLADFLVDEPQRTSPQDTYEAEVKRSSFHHVHAEDGAGAFRRHCCSFCADPTDCLRPTVPPAVTPGPSAYLRLW